MHKDRKQFGVGNGLGEVEIGVTRNWYKVSIKCPEIKDQ